MLIFAGLPFEYNSKLYNVAAAINNGRILGLVPKKYLPNYGEFYERRQFTPGFDKCVNVEINGMYTLFGTNILFRCAGMDEFVVGAEICEDLWTPDPPSTKLALHGATVLVAMRQSEKDSTGQNLSKTSLQGLSHVMYIQVQEMESQHRI